MLLSRGHCQCGHVRDVGRLGNGCFVCASSVCTPRVFYQNTPTECLAPLRMASWAGWASSSFSVLLVCFVAISQHGCLLATPLYNTHSLSHVVRVLTDHMVIRYCMVYPSSQFSLPMEYSTADHAALSKSPPYSFHKPTFHVCCHKSILHPCRIELQCKCPAFS